MIAWNPGCKGTRILQGFNIYLLPEPLTKMSENGELPKGIEPFNKLIYPGDTEGDPNRETYEIKEIDNSVIYYVHVRTVNSDGSLSKPSNEVELVTVARGEIALALAHSGINDGFSLDRAKYCHTNDLANDFYVFEKDSWFYLCSPARLSPVNRETRIYDLGSSNKLGDLPVDLPPGGGEQKVRLVKRSLYLVVTEEGHQAKLRMKYDSGNGTEKRIYFEYLYQPTPRKQDTSGS